MTSSRAERPPSAIGPRGRQPTTSGTWSSRPKGARSVLVVDDDDDVLDAMGALLEGQGYCVTTARNGADALIKLSQMALPSLILLDLGMPQLSGPDFLRQMLQDPTFSRIPVVVVSGSPLAREAAAGMGADGFLRKPVSPDELLELIASSLAGEQELEVELELDIVALSH